jgi:4-amino-4-deoxy-L-arabinose transferase-like glycosyltransferase
MSGELEVSVASPARTLPSAVIHGVALLFALLGALALVTTGAQLSATIDEGNHLAAGLEWWQHRTYTSFTENPPLGRVAVSAVPYWTGMRLPPRAAWDPHTQSFFSTFWVGLDLLHATAAYQTNLARARLGVLPFYLLVVGVVWALAGGRRRPVGGLLAVGLTATLPSLVAHGGLATTDVPFLGMLLLALLALRRWFERPSPARVAWLGAALAGAVLAKFTTLVFFPVILLSLLAARRLAGLTARPSMGGGSLSVRALGAQAGVALVVATLVVWAGYRFSWGAVGDLPQASIGWFPILPPVGERGPLTRRLLAMRVPFPELFHGLLFLKAHADTGHIAFLLGETSRSGFRWFYPIAFLVKTPLPFLAVTLASLVPIVRGRHRVGGWWWSGLTLAAATILALSTGNRINLGFRHVLIILPLLAVASAGAVASVLSARTLTAGSRRALVAALAMALAIQGASTWGARPNLLGWFNPLAGGDPAGVLLDSDNDWGQDLLQLRRALASRQVPALSIAYFGNARQCAHGLPPLRALPPGRPTRGWIAISENFYRERNSNTLGPDPCDPRARYRPADLPLHPFAWLKAYQPVAIVGSSIRLYHVP